MTDTLTFFLWFVFFFVMFLFLSAIFATLRRHNAGDRTGVYHGPRNK